MSEKKENEEYYGKYASQYENYRDDDENDNTAAVEDEEQPENLDEHHVVDEYNNDDEEFVDDSAIDDALNDLAKHYLDNDVKDTTTENVGSGGGDDGDGNPEEEDNELIGEYYDGYHENNKINGIGDGGFDDFYNDDENDKEFLKMFKMKINLSDGTQEYLFSSGVRFSRLKSNGKISYSRSYFPINCHLCKISGIRGKYTLRKHINSNEHKILLNGKPPNAKQYRKPFCQPYGIKHLVSPIKIYPGEIIKRITPEYYDRILPIKELEFKPRPSAKLVEELKHDRIHDYNQHLPLLGLCYAFKMKVNSRMTLYYCALCRTDLYGEAYQHFVGAGHQASYILQHFKNLHSRISETLEAKISSGLKRRKAVRSIFRVLYRKIEMLRGLRKISIIDTEDFHKSQRKLVNVCRNSLFQYHYDENTIDFDENEIKELIRKAINDEYIIETDPQSLKKPKNHIHKRSPSPFDSRNRLRLGRFKNPEDLLACSLSTITKSPSKSIPSLLSIETNQINDTPTDWDRYKRMLGATLDDLDQKYEKYEEDPENHPKYDSEWRSFWRRRVKELERDHIDPERYDFKPEWENVWADLLKKFYETDVARRKFDIKKSLHLPLTKRSPSPIRRRKPRSPSKMFSSSLSSIQHRNNDDNNCSRRSKSNDKIRYRSPSPKMIDDSYNKRSRLRSITPPSSMRYKEQQSHYDYEEQQRQQQSYHHHHSSSSSSARRRSIDYSPHRSSKHHERERDRDRGYEHHEKVSYNHDERISARTRSRSPRRRSSPSSSSRIEKHDRQRQQQEQQHRSLSPSQTELSVISILRLLTALEDQLGSLGPKAIDFLGKAIIYEKENKGNSNQLLNNQEYYMFFMTSMEKLRGQMMAKIVTPHRIRAVTNAINDLEQIIQQYDEYKHQNQVIFNESNNKIIPTLSQQSSHRISSPQSLSSIRSHNSLNNYDNTNLNYRINDSDNRNIMNSYDSGTNDNNNQRYNYQTSVSGINPFNKDPRMNAFKGNTSSGTGRSFLGMTSNIYGSSGGNNSGVGGDTGDDSGSIVRKHNETSGLINPERFSDLRNILSRSGSATISGGNGNNNGSNGGGSGAGGTNDGGIWHRGSNVNTNSMMGTKQMINSLYPSSMNSSSSPSSSLYYSNPFKITSNNSGGGSGTSGSINIRANRGGGGGGPDQNSANTYSFPNPLSGYNTSRY